MSLLRNLIIISVVILTVGVALYLPLSSPQNIFNTPDENANYFFAANFHRDDPLRVSESLSDKVDNAVHPRGVNIIRGHLVPESFLGLPILYGELRNIMDHLNICHPEEPGDEGSRGFNGGILRFAQNDNCGAALFTATLTLFALYALYHLFLHFFVQRVARLALFLVLILPVFLYWSGRPYMHTILFLDFLVIGWWLIVPPPSGGAPPLGGGTRASKYRWTTVAGIFIGLALAMRTSEIVWVGAGTLALLLPLRIRGNRRGLTEPHHSPQPPFNLKGEGLIWTRFLKLAFGVAIVLIPLLFLNQDLYGNFFGTGYSVSETNLIVEGAEVPQLARVSFVEQLLLPFGFHPLEAAARFLKYAFGGMWWYVAPMALGAIVGIIGVILRSRATKNPVSNTTKSFATPSLRSGFAQDDKQAGRYTMIWFTFSLYLIFVYGSFRAEVFADPMHPLGATIGAPYLRYWLPIFVFGAPLAAEFFVWMRFYVLRPTYYILAVVLMMFLSARAVVWYGPESWNGIQENLWNFAEARERTVRATPDDAVFIVPRLADRIYFPARRVIVDMEGKDVIQTVKALRAEDVPVFWLRGRGEIKLEPEIYDAGFRLERRFDVDPKGKVYEIIFNSPNSPNF